MIKICYGCGVKLQSEKEGKEGYIPLNKIENSSYCKRCFQLMHYGKTTIEDVPKENKTIISAVNNAKESAVFLIDFLNINSEVINLFKDIKCPKVLVISKIDALPFTIKQNNLINFIKEYYEIKDDVKVVSSNKNIGLDSLFNYLYDKNFKTVYILGLSNSGKSTLINKIIKNYNINKNTITTSKVPNTTREFIRVKIDDYLTLIDTPGFVINSLNYLYEKKINEKIFQMKKSEILKIDNLFLKFHEDTNINLYLPTVVNVKKHFKEENFNESIEIEKDTDLVIKGLGFICFKNKSNISISNISKDLIELRKSVLK